METQTFRVVIAYDSLATAIRAKQMAQHLAVELESKCHSLPFELMDVGRVRESAALIASEADMIIIAASGREELPHGVKEWIEDWLASKKPTRAALVALLDDDGRNEVSPPSTYLKSVAQRGNMDFFCSLGHSWQTGSSNVKRDLPERTPLEARMTRPLALANTTPEYSAARGWGIND